MRDVNNLKVRLLYWRKRRGFSVRKLVEKSGVSSATISKIEKTGNMPYRADVLNRLAAALSITVEDLVVDEEEERRIA